MVHTKIKTKETDLVVFKPRYKKTLIRLADNNGFISVELTKEQLYILTESLNAINKKLNP